MIVVCMLVLAVGLAFVRHRMGTRVRRVDPKTLPLAGYDTGVRFGRRVPGSKHFRPHRGF